MTANSIDRADARDAVDRIRVLSVGPDHREPGGMATVEQQILTHGGAVANVRAVVTHVQSSVARRAVAFARGCGQVLASLVTGRVDVLHLHVAEGGSVVRKGVLAYAGRAFGVPVVLHCHGAEFAERFERSPAVVRRLIGHAFRRAHRVIVLGEFWKQVYVGRVGVPADRIVVLRNAVRLPPVVPERPAVPLRLVFLGVLGARKGSFDLLHAVALLPADVRSRVRLALAGNGDVDGSRALVERLGLGDVVDVRGWLAPPERDELLARSSVLVLPSANEGLPLAMLEAMAWGLVPVVTAVGAIPELVTDGENGLMVVPGDVDGIAAALTALVEDPERTGRLATAARATAERHGLDAYIDALGDIWRSVR